MGGCDVDGESGWYMTMGGGGWEWGVAGDEGVSRDGERGGRGWQRVAVVGTCVRVRKCRRRSACWRKLYNLIKRVWGVSRGASVRADSKCTPACTHHSTAKMHGHGGWMRARVWDGG